MLADEPGTGKTIMTGMYLVEVAGAADTGTDNRRRACSPRQKWLEELEDFFGIQASRLTPAQPETPRISIRVDVWVRSIDLYTRNNDVRRKVAEK
ncbi:MAG: hypothetical protein IPN02_08075 [Candidatus Microthrix sp.]|uniref:Uncharacterized protein n=1 Tax=Candidatus Neomicrothrix subdominans TaxID=2954438 RepID=A0A936TCR3_9ACTN|nr:hypothetical protein [Candidatus Microthrix subdominans]